MRRFRYPPPQSEYWSVSTSQETFLLTFYNHTHLFLPLLPLPLVFSISKILWFQKCYINGIIQYVTFGDWLFSFNTISWRFIHIVCIDSSLLLLCSVHSMSLSQFSNCLLKDIWAISSFWLIWIKFLWVFVYRFCVKISFHFSEINTQEWSFCVKW